MSGRIKGLRLSLVKEEAVNSRERRAARQRKYVKASWYAADHMARLARNLNAYAKQAQDRARHGKASDFRYLRHAFIRLGQPLVG